MSENYALKKALVCICHPLSIGAVLLLWMNDHLLRQFFPSWWTGKLGDFAWLFFFPFILAACLAWLLPRRPRWISGLAFSLTGFTFILAKTLPSFHNLLTTVAQKAFGFPIRMQRDATDLIALFSLFGGVLLWKTIKAPSGNKSRLGLMWLTAGVILTIANMAQPDPGIYCLERVGEEVIACASYSCYGSIDGGNTWTTREGIDQSACPELAISGDAESKAISISAQPGILYSFTPGGDIQRSDDGGATWKLDYQLVPVSQAQKAYYQKTHAGNPLILNNPQDGIYDPTTGNVIFAMGHEGVLVRQAQGVYKLVQVGPYGKVKTSQFDVLMTIISGELGLAACFGGLVAVVLGLYEECSLQKKLVSVLGVVIWLFPVFFVPPALSAGSFAATLSSISTLLAGLLILPLLLDGFLLVGILAPDNLLKLSLLVIEGFSLFTLPYVLWALNLLPSYRLATVGAVILGGGFLLIQYRALMSGALGVRPEVSSRIEPERQKRAGWLFLAGAVLCIGGFGLISFGLDFAFIGVFVGWLIMLGGAWVRRQVWIAAKAAAENQVSSD